MRYLTSCLLYQISYKLLIVSDILPVACCMRYLHQVLPEPGKDARAVRDPVAALIPRFLHQVMEIPGILFTILLFSTTISALWILLSAMFLVSTLVREIRDTTMMYMQTKTLKKKILRRQSHSITLSNIYCTVVISRLECIMAFENTREDKMW